ncbi:MAG: cupin [Acidimicrobiales bacterium mtb01]|nr:cupin [Actinomycetota bacterium]TEX45290.1 MAG: cupin [Acidimicrobiales bacterium mtb01]
MLAAGIVIKSPDIDAPMSYLLDQGFRVERIFPADAPRSATLSGHGCRVHLETVEARDADAVIRLSSDDITEFRSDRLTDGTTVEWSPAHEPLVLPPLVSRFVVTEPADGWHVGRAGMQYRDLVPDRQGGAVIASHIRIPEAGPVPDYVHFHDVVFQLIFCHKGWAKLVYEDQGEPFVLAAGDCVIQPPRIRHRVLESSADLHVVELGYPAEHITFADPNTRLPTGERRPDREWSGQRFVHFVAADATWTANSPGWDTADTGIRLGTAGVADVKVHRVDEGTARFVEVERNEFRFLFVLEGRGSALVGGRRVDLVESTALVVPVGESAEVSGPLTLLDVSIPTN